LVARHTNRSIEQAAQFATWAADEHLLLPLALGLFVATQLCAEAARRHGNHVLLTAVVTAALPHVLKRLFSQYRPDRLTIRGHLHGVPLSGKRLDSFPSGHAIHIGAIAPAASQLSPKKRNAVWVSARRWLLPASSCARTGSPM
jgi:membrane-associated phospholipid phosphatase